MKITNFTWAEFKELNKSVDTAIIPWGALEAHGTHLPLSTDTIIAEHIATLIAGKINAFLLPPIPIGYSFHASNFPGTLSFTEHTLQQIAFDLAKSLSNNIQNIIFISGHGGNVEPLEEIAVKIRDELELDVLVIYLYFTDDELIKKFNKIKTSESIYDIFHAEEIETSLMLAISPHLVNMKEAKIEYPEVKKEHLRYEKNLGDLTNYCVFGDPTVANVAKGNQFLEIIVEEILKIIKIFQDFP